MAAGKKLRNSQVMDGRSFMDDFGITIDAAEKTDNVLHISGNDKDKAIVWYSSTDAITEADFAGLPIGSLIIDMQAKTLKLKDAAAGTASFVDIALT